MVINRDDFEYECADLFDRCVAKLDQVLQEIKFNAVRLHLHGMRNDVSVKLSITVCLIE